MTEPLFPARVVAIDPEAEGISSYWLEPISADHSVHIDPGSHIDVLLPNGMTRSYSLSNGIKTSRGYRLTIARDVNSRGGSVCMHDDVKVGQVLEISRPRNSFKLDEQASTSVFIAGGIGVTPFLPMMARLNACEKPWRMIYCMRNCSKGALLKEIESLATNGLGELVTHYDDKDGVIDLEGVIASLSPGDHIYCCGPTGMLDAFRACADKLEVSPSHVHLEYFKAEDVLKSQDESFQVVLHRSGLQFTVAPGETILQTLLDHGIDAPFSCEQGVCGSCETRVVEGAPDHRDLILSPREKAEGKTMMICCSGSKSARLVLDL
ncbi:MAG TPA: PDR/VanB family oxidoreductase [Paraburkholderia sp.]|uniref:PDR/VanB family oxidoreductase n=1 Tax=Paraburkholderia sp. TaxID=1926495 RepID=UPI002B493125|nr:PDR/VanB family oxidoreductase [Paraburkholderia sp.]HKR38297.1 PDR/VanB family oxidoreductase [Paraburkholderia sp.]